jgi:Family of unknown function (DUF6319)
LLVLSVLRGMMRAGEMREMTAMTAPGALTDRDVVAVRAESAARPVTVWFTAAAVGVPAGGSAKVVGVGDTDEGDFIQVRPAGSRDTVFCSPNELTLNRPARRRAAAAGDKTGTTTTQPPTRAAASPASEPVRKPAARPVRKPASPAPSTPAATVAAPPAPGGPVASSGASRPARAAGARRRIEGSGAMSVSLTATAAGEWTVEVLVGTKRVVASTPVDVAEVATVARSLPPAVAEAIESSLQSARERQRERVERLRAELDVAQRVLDKLGV